MQIPGTLGNCRTFVDDCGFFEVLLICKLLLEVKWANKFLVVEAVGAWLGFTEVRMSRNI